MIDRVLAYNITTIKDVKYSRLFHDLLCQKVGHETIATLSPISQHSVCSEISIRALMDFQRSGK